MLRDPLDVELTIFLRDFISQNKLKYDKTSKLKRFKLKKVPFTQKVPFTLKKDLFAQEMIWIQTIFANCNMIRTSVTNG